MMKNLSWKSLLLILALVLFLTACGGNTAETPASDGGDSNSAGDTTEGAIDPDSGLPINPAEDPEGPFIVEGAINSLNLTPQTSPEFVIKADNGRNYRIRTQSLADTYFDDGEAVPPSAFRQGMRARATVTYDAAQLIYFSDDFVVLRGEGE